MGSITRLILMSALVAGCSRAGHAQSLGELAKQEAERRKSVRTPARVYTNDTLGRGVATRASAAPTPSAPVASSGTPGGDEASVDAKTTATREPKKDEAAWREQIQTERDALRRAQVFAEALQSRINALTADFTARDDPAQRDRIAGDRQKALDELDRVKKEIDSHSKAIADIQTEARKAGVPPGWLR